MGTQLSILARGQRSLVGYGSQGRKESDMTERLTLHTKGFISSDLRKKPLRKFLVLLRNSKACMLHYHTILAETEAPQPVCIHEMYKYRSQIMESTAQILLSKDYDFS